MSDFVDFSQVESQPGNNDDPFGMGAGMQMNAQEDAFADAGLPAMGQPMDFNQGFGGQAAPADDYTDDERVLLQ